MMRDADVSVSFLSTATFGSGVGHVPRSARDRMGDRLAIYQIICVRLK
jgi:hypothetical protein